jgi:hypothetical protein
LSERNKTQGFFNASENFKGFNYRITVEFGPIIKLIGIKIHTSVIHPREWAIGVDDRTL